MPLTPPQRDGEGNVVPHDHQEIAGECGIIRRISEHFVVEGDLGQKRISSMAFRPSSGPNGGMSIDIESSIVEAGVDPREHVTSPRWIGSIRFTAQALRNEQFQVGFDPLEENAHHGQVWGAFSKPQQKRLREICDWFVVIEGVAIGV